MGSLRQVDLEPRIALLRPGRVAHENELLEVFQRKGAGLPQGPRPD